MRKPLKSNRVNSRRLRLNQTERRILNRLEGTLRDYCADGWALLAHDQHFQAHRGAWEVTDDEYDDEHELNSLRIPRSARLLRPRRFGMLAQDLAQEIGGLNQAAATTGRRRKMIGERACVSGFRRPDRVRRPSDEPSISPVWCREVGV